MTAGGGGALADPVRLHLPGAVHRPRPDLRPHDRRVRRRTCRPADLLQGRSPSARPRLALRRGPARPGVGRVLRGRRAHLKMGKTDAAGRAAGDGRLRPAARRHSAAAKRTAIIPDHRNDENLAVAQTHLAMIRFHNRVVDKLRPRCRPAQRFAARARLVISTTSGCSARTTCRGSATPAVVDDVFTNGRKVFEVGAAPTDVPTMPIEFSVAAFRLGHCMVRARLQLEHRVRRRQRHAGPAVLLLGHERRPGQRRRGCRATGSPTGAGCTSSQPAAPTGRRRRSSTSALRIDTLLVEPARRAAARLLRRPGAAGRRDRRQPRVPQPRAGARWSSSRPGSRWPPSCRARASRVTPLTKAQIRDGNGRRDARRAHGRAARRVPREHAAVVLHPARGRAQRRPAHRRRRADRRRDVPPGDGGQHALDRARPGLRAEPRPERHTFDMRDLLFSRSRARRSCWRRWGTERARRRSANCGWVGRRARRVPRGAFCPWGGQNAPGAGRVDRPPGSEVDTCPRKRRRRPTHSLYAGVDVRE